jgi:hypothetical protein
MTFQTEVLDGPEELLPGQIADSGDHNIISCVSDADVVMGRFVADAGLAADGKTQKALLPAANAGTDKLLGVVVRTHTVEVDSADPYPTIPAGKPFGVLRRGRVGVSVDAAFDPASDTAYVRFTANGATKQPGMLTDSDDTGKADELDASGYLVRHRVLRARTAAGVIPVEINLPS